MEGQEMKMHCSQLDNYAFIKYKQSFDEDHERRMQYEEYRKLHEHHSSKK